MGKKFHNGLLIGVLVLFVAVCALSITEFVHSSTLADQLNGTSSEAEQLKKMQSQLQSALDSEQKTNSQLSQQLNSLQSSYNDLQSQVAKIQQTKAASKGKVAYLTFDDGPSNITGKILDTLKANNAHATFFVVGTNASQYPALVKRAYSEGNAVGIHSWSHVYSYIYASEPNFMADFNKLKDYLTNLLGTPPQVSRYPGGTNETVGNQYGDHVMRKVDPEVKAMGIKPYDWNSYVGDAESGPKPTPDQIVKNCMKYISASQSEPPVILMHDTDPNGNDVQALPEIIRQLRAQGYTLGTLSKATPTVQWAPK